MEVAVAGADVDRGCAVTTRRPKPNFAALRRKLLTWPGVEEGSHYGQPSIKAFSKFLTRAKEDGDSIVISGVSFDEREMLIETQGDVFYITDHYRNYPSILMRLSVADPAAVEAMLRRRWRELAPKKIRAEYDAMATAAAPNKTRRKTT
jgi:hypothetical protein